ncbi:MAG: porin family protein [Candidatus Eiseniibacteriota bacterium]
MRACRVSRQIVLLAALSLLPATAGAAGIRGIGLKGGLSVATLHGRLPTDGLIENGTKLGFGGGMSLSIPLGHNVSFQPELIYAMKGTSFGEFDLTDSTGTTTGKAELLEVLGYIEIPLLARISLPTGGPASPFVMAGPVVGLRVSQQLRVTGDLSDGTDIDLFRGADLGVALAAGLELGRGPVRGTLEGRYTLGLTPAAKSTYSDDARNGSLLVMMGIVLQR